MLIDDILSRPNDSLQYMERLVNDGSPSNFSFKYTSSRNTCPLFTSSFYLCKIETTPKSIENFGVVPSQFNNPTEFLLHPDWRGVDIVCPIVDTNIAVAPTSSSRTVRVLETDYYLKLSYPGILGRITRELRREHIFSSIDISDILQKLLNGGALPSRFAFFPELGGRLYHSNGGDIGLVIRDAIPMGKKACDIQSLIPAFSLFSSDRGKMDDAPLIVQILARKSHPIQYIKEQLLYPLLDIFFLALLKGGLMFELHAQNFLIGIDENCDIVSLVVRDLESADKDLSLMQEMNIHYDLLSSPYKCISADQYNYRIKHSFMYDHKIGEYFFDPLLKCMERNGFSKKTEMEKAIKDYVNKQYFEIIDMYFPKGKWYKFQNILVDRSVKSRPYVSFEDVKYR